MDIVDEAKELIPWLDEDSLVTRMAKHIEYLRLQNERLRQQNAKLVAVAEEVVDPENGNGVGSQVWLDKVHDILAKGIGDK